ncbi:MAG: putative 2-aminoethylphosphonate ABC transporter permease subunit [Candidatus Tectimicrobiota bacterium]
MIVPRARTVSVPLHQTLGRDDWLMGGGLLGLGLWLIITVLLPLWALLSRSVQARDGTFVGLANFTRYFATPTLSAALTNSLWLASVSTVLCVLLAFLCAYGLTRTCMAGRRSFMFVTQLPLLMPSLLPAISLVYLFGRQGLLTPLVGGVSIYGPLGLVLGEVFWTLPHALLIVHTALSLADARLYEAAEALGAGPWKIFWTVTLPGARYGLVSAATVVFTLVMTDFGVPKVLGGSYHVLATEIYKQVIGQQNFEMGAVIGLLLLGPAVLACGVDRVARRHHTASLTARSVPYVPKPVDLRDTIFGVFCAAIALGLVGLLAISILASVVHFWPYNLSLTLKHYRFEITDGGGWESYGHSLLMATGTALCGTAIVFCGAYVLEKMRRLPLARACVQLLALLPLAVPGLVLGLGYILFFNAAANPLHGLYGTMTILIICTVAHFYAVAHLTATTALQQLDPAFETVSATLKVPLWRTFARVHTVVCLPAICDIALYFFVNAMTTVSAVVFLYAPDTTLAAVAVLNMDDAGDAAPAAAMAVLIFATTGLVRLGYTLVTQRVLTRTQRWRAGKTNA